MPSNRQALTNLVGVFIWRKPYQFLGRVYDSFGEIYEKSNTLLL